MIAEDDGGSTPTLTYTWSGVDDLVAIHQVSDGAHYYVVQDQLHSVRGLAARSDGSPAVSWRYRAYGALLDSAGLDSTATPPVTVRYRWVGREYDQETGFCYMRARYYDPSTQRFTQEDPIGGPGDYGYAGGNPIMARDPDGLSPDPVVGYYRIALTPDWDDVMSCLGTLDGCHERSIAEMLNVGLVGLDLDEYLRPCDLKCRVARSVGKQPLQGGQSSKGGIVGFFGVAACSNSGPTMGVCVSGGVHFSKQGVGGFVTTHHWTGDDMSVSAFVGGASNMETFLGPAVEGCGSAFKLSACGGGNNNGRVITLGAGWSHSPFTQRAGTSFTTASAPVPMCIAIVWQTVCFGIGR